MDNRTKLEPILAHIGAPTQSSIDKSRAPPHPLEATWYVSIDEQVYGPYSGHELKEFAQQGRIDSATNVMREGSENWTKAGADPRLNSVFHLPRTLPSIAPQSSISAEKGATIVQVTNQIAPHPQLAFAVDAGAPFGPKSPGVALLLSILLCGAGQMYNGQVAKGIGMMFLCLFLWFILLGWIINLWSWVDAYQTATAMRDRYQRRLTAGLPV